MRTKNKKKIPERLAYFIICVRQQQENDARPSQQQQQLTLWRTQTQTRGSAVLALRE